MVTENLPPLLAGHGGEPLVPGADGHVDLGVEEDEDAERDDAAEEEHDDHGDLGVDGVLPQQGGLRPRHRPVQRHRAVLVGQEVRDRLGSCGREKRARRRN